MGAINKKWTEEAQRLLVGKTIKSVRYETQKEVDGRMGFCRGLVIELDDETVLWPMSDDEGNEAGAIHFRKFTKAEGKWQIDGNGILPVLGKADQ